MNVLNMFEDRVGAIFGTSRQGYTAPFSFKKLAKQAAREMEAETFVVNGVNTAPGLYTILVSKDDDLVMRPLYAQITSETSQFIQAQAQKHNYVFVGEPVVRFMADPSLRSGKFSVFAENVDARTLDRLRSEEADFLHPGARKKAEAAEAPAADSDGFDKIPFDVDIMAPGEAAVPATQLREDVDAGSDLNGGVSAEISSVPQKEAVTALLIDRESGQTYTATAPRTIIGRERTPKGIVLKDPNVSRRHSEMTYADGEWSISDLNSTNGTLVNDVDIDECVLRDGDTITLGLVNLEFREN